MATVDDNKPDEPIGTHEQPTLNKNNRPQGTVIDTVVVHADAGKTAAGTVSWIKDDDSDVSYHSLVERDGDLHRFVDPDERAWHAGKSRFDNKDDVNDFSLGISLANRNDGEEEYTELQYAVGAAEVAGWMKAYPAITLARIVTHAEVATPAGRKTDPGPKFNLEKFKEWVRVTLESLNT